jgi:TPR repeat protein
VPQDFNIAYRLAKESAEQGEPMGQYVLGLMFFSGKGVPQNAGESLKWMQAAARHGEGHAQQFLQERGQSW